MRTLVILNLIFGMSFSLPATADSRFTDLLRQGDLEIIANYLEGKSREDLTILQSTLLPNGQLPIIYAAQSGNLVLLDLLFQLGADPNARDRQGRDIVNIAIRTGNTELARRAIAAGTDPTNLTVRYQGSTLIFASDRGEVEIVKMLIESGAPLDRRNSLGWTALLEATVLGNGGPDHLKVVELLLEAGADQTIGDHDGVTPLQHAERRGHRAMAALLRKYSKVGDQTK